MQTVCTDFYGNEHVVDSASVIERISAYGIFISSDRVLLIQDPNSLRWELPGGGLEGNETIRQGLVREFIEETGLVMGGRFVLLREWVELFYDTASQQAWRAQRKFYLVEKKKSGTLLKDGNSIDSGAVRMVPRSGLDGLTIVPRIKETILLAFDKAEAYAS